MRRFLHPDIRQRLWIALGLLALSTLFVGGIAWYTLDRAAARMQQLHSQTLVEVSNSLRLSRQSADVARSAPYLLNLQSSYLIRREETRLLEALKAGIGPWPSKTAVVGSPIHIHEEDIAGFVHQIKIAVQDFGNTAEMLFEERDKTLVIAVDLSEIEDRLFSFATDPGQTTQQRQAWLMLQTMTNALSGAAQADNLLGVGERRRKYQRLRRTFLTRVDARGYSIFVNQLEMLANGEEGLFTIRRRELSHKLASHNALFRIQYHAAQISDLVSQFVQSSEDYLSSERDKTATSIDVTKLFILVAGIGSVGVALMAALYVSNYVTGNIRDISSAMLKLAQGDRTTKLDLKPKAHDEIGKLLQSFRGFRANALRLDRSNRQLHQKNALFEKIFANISDGVAITTDIGHLNGTNPNVAAVLRADAVALKGKQSIGSMFASSAFSEQLITAGVDADFRGYTEVRNAEGHTLEIRCNRLPDGGGIWLFSDATERREMETRLRQIRQIEKLGKVTGEVAHDFGNILSTITANMHLLEEGTKSVAPNVLMQRVVSAAEIGTSLTQRLLAFARKQRLVPEVVELNELVEGLTDLISISLSDDVTIRAKLNDSAVFVRVDPGQLESAILNLCLNAGQAISGVGDVTISVGVTAGNMASIDVVDTGCGMSESVVSSSLEPFFTTRDVGGGTGLGLSMVYGFIKQTGGDIQIKSKVGKGTRIRLLLPLRHSREDVQQIYAPANKTALLVEDEPEAMEAAAIYLRQLGYAVTKACTYDAAKDAIKSGGLEVMVTDLHLDTGHSGWELVHLYRKKNPVSPIVVASGRMPDAHPYSNGEDPYVVCVDKPLTLEVLHGALASALEGDRAKRA